MVRCPLWRTAQQLLFFPALYLTRRRFTLKGQSVAFLLGPRGHVATSMRLWLGATMWNWVALIVGKECVSRQSPISLRPFARRFADRWLGEVEEFGSLDLLSGTLELQGGRFAVEQAFNSVKCTAAGYFSEAGANLSGALEVQVDRVAIPEATGTVNPASILPADRKAVFENLGVVASA